MTTKRFMCWGKSPTLFALSALSLLSSLEAEELPVPESLRSDAQGLAIIYVPVDAIQVKSPAVSPWKQTNQRVGEIGGWMFYATEASSDGEDPHKADQKPTSKNHEGHK
ncbi:MAG: hypothetical protein KKF22_12115 [Gammaproteobacteria bacterium]|nr:hypothetical protein [Gammaproteobacteria bacterium]